MDDHELPKRAEDSPPLPTGRGALILGTVLVLGATLIFLTLNC